MGTVTVWVREYHRTCRRTWWAGSRSGGGRGVLEAPPTGRGLPKASGGRAEALQWICGEKRLSGKPRRSCSKFPQSWVTQEWHCSSLCSQETHGQKRYGVWVREIRVVQPLYSTYSFLPNESSCKCKMSCRFELTIPSRRHLSCFWRVAFKSMVTADPRGLDTNSDSLCRIRKNKVWSR